MLKMIADALHDTVQCPVCLTTLRPPVSLCSSGHGICPDCKPHVNVCPTCREGFIQTNPLILHQLLEALPRSCQFKSSGCTDVYILGGQHESLCSYRTVNCKTIGCEWSGQNRKLQSHLTSSHIETTVVLQNEMKAEVKWDSFDVSQDSFKYIPFVAYDQVFWEYIHMNTDVKKLCISFTHSSNGDSNNYDYYSVITFKKGHIQYTYTIKIPMDNNHGFDDFYEEFCMTIPENMTSKFVNIDSSLVYNVHILRETK